MGDVIGEALQAARLALVSHNNCLITDRPDLPRSDDTGWTTDFRRELYLLDRAIDSMNTCPRSPDGNSGQPTVPLSAPARPEAAHRSSRTPCGGRS